MSQPPKGTIMGIPRLDRKSDFPPPHISEDELHQFRKTTTLRQIEIVCMVWQLSSITKAAAALGVSNAAVSRMCQRFDGHFNFPIFEKRRKGVELTPQGAKIIGELAELKRCIEQTSNRLAEMFDT